jgi:hypothetical protein
MVLVMRTREVKGVDGVLELAGSRQRISVFGHPVHKKLKGKKVSETPTRSTFKTSLSTNFTLDNALGDIVKLLPTSNKNLKLVERKEASKGRSLTRPQSAPLLRMRSVRLDSYSMLTSHDSGTGTLQSMKSDLTNDDLNKLKLHAKVDNHFPFFGEGANRNLSGSNREVLTGVGGSTRVRPKSARPFASEAPIVILGSATASTLLGKTNKLKRPTSACSLKTYFNQKSNNLGKTKIHQNEQNWMQRHNSFFNRTLCKRMKPDHFCLTEIRGQSELYMYFDNLRLQFWFLILYPFHFSLIEVVCSETPSRQSERPPRYNAIPKQRIINSSKGYQELQPTGMTKDNGPAHNHIIVRIPVNKVSSCLT